MANRQDDQDEHSGSIALSALMWAYFSFFVLALVANMIFEKPPARPQYMSVTTGASPPAELDQLCRAQEALVSGRDAALAVYDACMSGAGYVPR